MDDVVMLAASFALALGFVGRGVWTVFTGGPLVIKSTGRCWRTPGRAGAFWLLIGSGLLVSGFLRIAGRAGYIGADAGFWLSLLPYACCGLALIGFWPHRPAHARPR
jgi:hypothetical protein